MRTDTDRPKANLLALAACIFFVGAGAAFLPLLGTENDEALFASPWFQPYDSYDVHLLRFRIPLMLMSYLGTLKSWLWLPLFKVFGTGVWVLRFPALLAGAASIWVFYLLLRRIAGSRTALVGCWLLALDSTYLLTSCFDWGPVAMQHLLLLGGALLLLRFYQQGGDWALAGGAFLLGAGMWDKALAVWMLSAAGVAALAVFRKEIWRVTGFRRLGIVVAGFSVGALPLIVYNVNTGLSTFKGQGYSTADFPVKVEHLKRTLDGSVLFGYLTAEDGETPKPHAPVGPLQNAVVRLSELAGRPRKNVFIYAFGLALLAIPFLRGWELRAALFCLITMAVQWLQMAITMNAGASAHHTILVWPLPVMLVAICLAALCRRMGRAATPALVCLTAIMLISGALQLNEYYRMARQNGGSKWWNDGIFGLSTFLRQNYSTRIYATDWGIVENLRLLDHGGLAVEAIFGAAPEGAPPDAKAILDAAASPAHVFIAHTAPFEFFGGASDRVARFAWTYGYRRETVATISDTYGRPFFEVYHFIR